MLCTLCGQVEINSNNPEVDFCMICAAKGRQFDRYLQLDDRSNLLEQIRMIQNVTAAEIIGDGAMFRLAVTLSNQPSRLFELIAGFRKEDEDGVEGVVLQAAIPPEDNPWGIGIVENAWDWSSGDLEFKMISDLFDDDELVEAVRLLANDHEFETINVKKATSLGIELGGDREELMRAVGLEPFDTKEQSLIGRADDPATIAFGDQYLAQGLDAIRKAGEEKKRWLIITEQEGGITTIACQGPETSMDDGQFAVTSALSLMDTLKKSARMRDEANGEIDEGE